MRHQEYQVKWLGFTKLAEVIQRATCEEICEIVAQLQESVQLIGVVVRQLSLAQALDLFLEL